MKPDPKTFVLLVMPPMLWAGNAVIGRLMVAQLPPVMMNALRWALVALILAPLARGVWQQGPRLRVQWPYLALIGALGVGSYNALQYLALQTSSPLNVTLIASSMPIWMMLVGAVGHGQRILRRQALGAVLSMAGVVLVMAQGRWSVLQQFQWVPGDWLMLLAALIWSIYSWLLARPPRSVVQARYPAWGWAEFLWLQVVFGLAFALLCTGLEFQVGPPVAFHPDSVHGWWPLTGGLVFLALGPSILAYWAWGRGVQAVGPTVAAFFNNLTPVFAALWSWCLLGQWPQWYHPAAFVLIAAGIVVSSTPPRTA